jgi:hypothetical protein
MERCLPYSPDRNPPLATRAKRSSASSRGMSSDPRLPGGVPLYERLFEWRRLGHGHGRSGMPDVGRKGVVLGGMFNLSPQMPAPPAWLHYVLVDDVNRAVDAVKSVAGRSSTPDGSAGRRVIAQRRPAGRHVCGTRGRMMGAQRSTRVSKIASPSVWSTRILPEP